MGISQEKFYRIYEQIYENPRITFEDAASNLHISRNTVSDYLKEMCLRNIMVGPYLTMNPSENYREYVYLLKFENPLDVFDKLKQFPNIIYHSVTTGDWNTLIMTDRLLDLSQLKGFQTEVYRGVKGYSYTPKVVVTSWGEGFKTVGEFIMDFAPRHPEKFRGLAPFLTWNEDEWKLYHAFKDDLRKKVTPTLRKIGVDYEIHRKWMKTVKSNCTIHTEFYPEGYEKYLSYCFLISSDHETAVHQVFESLPVTSYIMEAGDFLLVFISVLSAFHTRCIFCTLYDMKTKAMIKEFRKALVLLHCKH